MEFCFREGEDGHEVSLGVRVNSSGSSVKTEDRGMLADVHGSDVRDDERFGGGSGKRRLSSDRRTRRASSFPSVPRGTHLDRRIVVWKKKKNEENEE